MCRLTDQINARSRANYNRIKTMKTRKAFNEAHPELNTAQQQAAYMLCEIDGWELNISEPTFQTTLTKDGRTLTLDQKGNAL